MGGGQSRSAPEPPRVVQEPYPTIVGADGISLSQAVKCRDCRLDVDANISASLVKLTRELGDISPSECASYNRDKNRVEVGTLGLQEFLVKLRAGEYARESATVDGQVQCQMLSISDETAASITSVAEVESKLDKGRIRRRAGGGGYSSATKARYIPSIPFKMKFNATQIVESSGPTRSVPLEKSFDITQMTLYYPSPIRIDSVQADAVLSLNDPSDSSATAIVLVPLRASSGGGGATEFIRKIAGQLLEVEQYDRGTGTYPSVNIQTGSDWSLSKLFTMGELNDRTSTVKNGFFTWTGMGELEPYLKSSTPYEIRHSWRRKTGDTAPQYFVLDTPLAIDPTDLSTIARVLPPTDPILANHAIPNINTMIFHKDAESPAIDTLKGRSGSCGIGDLCEGYANIGTAEDPMETACPGAKCDPFLQYAKNAAADATFSTQNVFGYIFYALTVLAAIVGAYIALVMILRDYEVYLRDFSETLGKVVAIWAKGISNLPIPSISKLKSIGMSVAQSQISSRSPGAGPSP